MCPSIRPGGRLGQRRQLEGLTRPSSFGGGGTGPAAMRPPRLSRGRVRYATTFASRRSFHPGRTLAASWITCDDSSREPPAMRRRWGSDTYVTPAAIRDRREKMLHRATDLSGLRRRNFLGRCHRLSRVRGMRVGGRRLVTRDPRPSATCRSCGRKPAAGRTRSRRGSRAGGHGRSFGGTSAAMDQAVRSERDGSSAGGNTSKPAKHVATKVSSEVPAEAPSPCTALDSFCVPI